ncbi:sugar efflux transporter for intercellular exchange-domain-containing protein [Hyaloraphidium curvatum]|nr:sugar efflux transporter for intercellular exchange-domain-containing protein [Hyaloraphidium curvatum]
MAEDCPAGTWCHFLAFTAAPFLGSLFALALYLSPFPAVLRVRSSGRLGALNTFPYPFIVGNCFAWLFYGYFLRDPYLVLPNVFGACTGFLYVGLTGPFLDAAASLRNSVALAVLVGWDLLGAHVAFVFFGPGDEGKKVLGWCAVIMNVAFFASPLSALWKILRSGDASSVHLPLAVATVVNCSLWTTYGFFLRDPFIFFPNAFGLLSAVAQLILACVFPRLELSEDTEPVANGVAHADEEAQDADGETDVRAPVLPKRGAGHV